jgi:glucose/arabinose dehydrogenase
VQQSFSRRFLVPWGAVAVTFLIVFLGGCGDDGGGGIQAPPPAASVATVGVTAPNADITAGQTLQLTATAYDSGGSPVPNVTFAWASSSAEVATVSSSGLVTGMAEGQADITATTEGVSGTLAVNVTAAPLPPPPTGPVQLKLQNVASGLAFPVYLTSPPGDSRLFVLEKGGTIRIIKNGSVLPQPFLDISTQVSTRTEQGLLGMAFPSDFATSHRFFIYYTDLQADSRVSSFLVSSDPDRADKGSEAVVLHVEQPGPSHKAGQIVFGPDGFLYIGLGDGGSRDGMDKGRGQSLSDLLGSILRLDVSSGTTYTVPPDNPFVATAGARPEIWAYGFRNPWRFSFDPATGDLYIGDVGESRWEEVDYSSASDAAGRGHNYGWSLMEGPDCFDGRQCNPSDFSLPVLQYSHSDGCAIAGGYVYRGSALPALQGQYFYSDFCQGWVRSFRIANGAATDQTDWPSLDTGAHVTSWGQDAAGELYLMTAEGSVLKIVSQ